MKYKWTLFVCVFATLSVLVVGATNSIADDRSKLIEKMVKQLTKDKNADKREEAAKTLGDLEAVEAVPALAAALKDPDADVRWDAAYSLFQIAPKATDAIPQLKEALKDTSGHVRLNAVAALEKMDVPKQEMIPSMRELLKDPDAKIRVDAADALITMEVPLKELLPALSNGLKDSNPKVAEAASESLARMNDFPKEALPVLMDAVKNANPKVRENALACVGKMGMLADQAVPVVVQALKDADGSVRGKAVDALEAIGPGAKRAIPALSDVIQHDPDASTRKYAVRALTRIDVNDPAAVAAFLSALKDQDEDVRTEAIDEAFRVIQPLSSTAVAALKETAAHDSSEINRRHADGILKDSQKPGQPVAKLQVTPRPQMQPLLEQLDRELKDEPTLMKDASDAKKYLQERDIAFTADEFWGNLTEGYADVVEAFLKLGMSPNTQAPGHAQTPLLFSTSYCSGAGEAQISVLLLLYGADPNVKDEINRTPIYAAAEGCDPTVVKALLMAGAHTNIVTNGGSTVLAAAVQSRNPEVVRMILNSGYKITKEPSYLLDSAKNAEIKQMLLKAGVKK